MQYNFLILHGLPESRQRRITTNNFLTFLERYAPGTHNFLYHQWDQPVTPTIRSIDHHIVVLTSTALNSRRRRPRERYYRIRDEWLFLASLDAVKIAFPQDDYDHTEELDKLFNGLGVDIVYTVIPHHKDMLYPMCREAAELRGVLTGYVDDATIGSMAEHSKCFEDRSLDIFQRAKMHSPSGGFYSQIKGRMATRFRELSASRGLRVDISTRPADVLYGDQWLKCLGDSRYVLGCESGASLWDRHGQYRDVVVAYTKRHADATFAEVEAACFPGKDGEYVFSAVSPRLFEAALMGCCQILIEGDYLGVLHPWEHYIPVRADFGNADQAIDATRDHDAARRRIEACYETLINNPAFRYSSLAIEVMEDVERLSNGRGFRETPRSQFREAAAQHRRELVSWKTWNACRPAAEYGGQSRGIRKGDSASRAELGRRLRYGGRQRKPPRVQ